MNKKRYFSFFTFSALLILIVVSCKSSQDDQYSLNLSGTWSYCLDRHDQGVSEGWFNRSFDETLELPGSLASNGIGDEVDLNTPWTGMVIDSSFFKDERYAKYRTKENFKIPFWLQPLKHYVGAVWFEREITIPKHWQGMNLELFLERCHWETQLWVDGKQVGTHHGLGTPHRYDLTTFLSPGKHRIALRVDNRIKEIDPGINAHSVSDHTQSNWNGIIGELALKARPHLHIKSLQVYPELNKKEVLVKMQFAVPEAGSHPVSIDLEVCGHGKVIRASQEAKVTNGQEVLMTVAMGDDVKLWDEFNPNRYTLKARVSDTHGSHTQETTFGMREISHAGGRLHINGKPIFLRGTLECCIFPKTGYPPTDVDSWLKIIDICRNHGLNHIRFHSWCPPKAAFEAADQRGFYLQAECSAWPNHTTSLGDGAPIDRFLYHEASRMIEEYGNHPSFCLMTHGNEPAGRNKNQFLVDFINHLRSVDRRRLYTAGAGWPLVEENDFQNSPRPRIQRWGDGLKSIINSEIPRTDFDWSSYCATFNQPVVSHEIGQWCVYPNLREIEKYDGVLKARNFEIFKETLELRGLGHLGDSLLWASGKLQALCYKADIEAALRTANFGGFQLLDLHDFPGQGTALVGVLDVFWEQKGYISPDEFRHFCNTTVPLARMPKMIYANGETLSAKVEVAHFGEHAFKQLTPTWKIRNRAGDIIMKGSLKNTDIPSGTLMPLGEITVPLAKIIEPEQLTLEIQVDSFVNCWNFWVYPEELAPKNSKEILLVDRLNSKAKRVLNQGDTVILSLRKGTLNKTYGGDIAIGFSSIFWNTAWSNGQAPHTLGILCNPKHPALSLFPTEYHSDWQWWDAMTYSHAIDLDHFSSTITPIVRVIDDWFTNRSLGLLFEARVGEGKLLISGIDFHQDMDKRLSARQLLSSLKNYLSGGSFAPTAELTIEELEAFCE